MLFYVTTILSNISSEYISLYRTIQLIKVYRSCPRVQSLGLYIGDIGMHLTCQKWHDVDYQILIIYWTAWHASGIGLSMMGSSGKEETMGAAVYTESKRHINPQWHPSTKATTKTRYSTTVRCRYNAVNFLTKIHKRHPIARPLGRGMVCL